MPPLPPLLPLLAPHSSQPRNGCISSWRTVLILHRSSPTLRTPCLYTQPCFRCYLLLNYQRIPVLISSTLPTATATSFFSEYGARLSYSYHSSSFSLLFRFVGYPVAVHIGCIRYWISLRSRRSTHYLTSVSDITCTGVEHPSRIAYITSWFSCVK